MIESNIICMKNLTLWVKSLPERNNFWRVVLVTIGILGMIYGNPTPDICGSGY